MDQNQEIRFEALRFATKLNEGAFPEPKQVVSEAAAYAKFIETGETD